MYCDSRGMGKARSGRSRETIEKEEKETKKSNTTAGRTDVSCRTGVCRFTRGLHVRYRSVAKQIIWSSWVCCVVRRLTVFFLLLSFLSRSLALLLSCSLSFPSPSH